MTKKNKDDLIYIILTNILDNLYQWIFLAN